ncbi:MAG: hypothetical protein NVSMB14_03580 [Isosphaeraceae bacterium]
MSRIVGATLAFVSLSIAAGSFSQARPKGGVLEDAKTIVVEGASFTGPKSWISIEPRKKKTKGCFISPDSTEQSPKAMIMIDAGKPLDSDLKAAAEHFAKDWGGKVLDKMTTLDGEKALRFRVEKPKEGLHPVEGIVAIRDGRLWAVMGGVVPGHSVIDQVEGVRKGWKWINNDK